MDADSQHFKGQGIDEPSQPEENAVWLEKTRRLAHDKGQQDQDQNSQADSQKEINHSDARQNSCIKEDSLSPFTENCQKAKSKYGKKTSCGCYSLHLAFHEVIPFLNRCLAVQPDTNQYHHGDSENSHCTLDNFTIGSGSHCREKKLQQSCNHSAG